MRNKVWSNLLADLTNATYLYRVDTARLLDVEVFEERQLPYKIRCSDLSWLHVRIP